MRAFRVVRRRSVVVEDRRQTRQSAGAGAESNQRGGVLVPLVMQGDGLVEVPQQGVVLGPEFLLDAGVEHGAAVERGAGVEDPVCLCVDLGANLIEARKAAPAGVAGRPQRIEPEDVGHVVFALLPRHATSARRPHRYNRRQARARPCELSSAT